MNIVIAGGGLQGISSARSLKEAGCKVGLWTIPGDPALKSSAVDYFGFESYTDNIASLTLFLKDNKADAVIPMSDDYARNLAANKRYIENLSGCRAAVPDIDVLETASDKQRLMNFCERNGFPHPLTVSSESLSENIPDDLPFPLLIKPNISVGSRGIVCVHDIEELRHHLPEVTAKYGACHLQEYIDSKRPYYNVMVFRDSHGKCTHSAVLEIIRYYPLRGGSSSMCRSIKSDRLTNLCADVLCRMDYYGFADFDVLQTDDGDYRIIEINPRVPASLRGAAISGVNFPLVIASDILGKDVEPQHYAPGKTLRFLGLDIMWFLSSPSRFKSKPSWFRFIGKDIYYQEGGIADFKPMIASLKSNLDKIEFKNGRIRKKA